MSNSGATAQAGPKRRRAPGALFPVHDREGLDGLVQVSSAFGLLRSASLLEELVHDLGAGGDDGP
jgi:hypothetical protein